MASSESTSASPSWLTSAWMDFIAGWCSGAMAVLCCQPVDTLLTKYQVATTPKALRNSTPWVLARQYLWSQPRILWSGSTCMVSAVPFQNALLMTGYGWGKQAWCNDNDTEEQGSNYQKKIMGIFIGGMGGGMLQSFVTSPVEWIKVQQQLAGGGVSTASTTSAASTSTAVLLRNLAVHPWRGLHATLWRDGIPHGVWFCSYEICKDAMETQERFDKVTTSLVSGAVAATVAWAVGYPFDLIKTRIQAINAVSSTASVEPVNLSIWTMARQIMSEGGAIVSSAATTGSTATAATTAVFPNVFALYRGFGWKLVRAIPASMIGFTTYEFVVAQLQTIAKN